jgi:polygalacturonase
LFLKVIFASAVRVLLSHGGRFSFPTAENHGYPQRVLIFAAKYKTHHRTMKKTLSLIVACLSTLLLITAQAATYSKLYQQLPVSVAQPDEPKIPKYKVSLTDFGAKGDGLTLNTEAFAQAISALTAKGGGHLVVPAGIWLTGPITLASHIDLHLEKNAIILFSPDKSLYVDNSRKTGRFLPGLTADRCTDLSITGEGIIDGNGGVWRPVKRGKVSDVEWKAYLAQGGVQRQEGGLYYPWQMKSGFADADETPERQESRRNDLFRIYNCERVLLQGITFQNSPKFHVHPLNCRSVILDGITVRCPWNAQNGDAIDISDCHRVLITGTTVDAGDDGLCMKSGNFNEKALVNGCEDILIDDNTVFHAHGGFVIGSESICGMKRIVVRNCRFSGTDTGLRFKSAVTRGGKTEDLYLYNIMMNDIAGEAIVFQCNYADRPAGDKGNFDSGVAPNKVPEFTDIHIYDVTCVNTKTAIAASGVEGLNCVHGIDIRDAVFVYNKTATAIDTTTAQLNLTNVQLVPLKADRWPVQP